jgi:hypothetical protein
MGPTRSAEAQPSSISELQPKARKLETSTRLARMRSAAKVGGGFTINIGEQGSSSSSSSSSSGSSSGGTPPGPLYRLTPEVPRPNVNTLTRIAGAKPLHFEIGTSNDGIYRMLNGPDAPKIHINLVTEASKVYVLDCAIDPATPSTNPKVTVNANGQSADVTITDGHIFAAFQASGISSTIQLGLLDRGTTYAGFFYGCDVFKSN